MEPENLKQIIVFMFAVCEFFHVQERQVTGKGTSDHWHESLVSVFIGLSSACLRLWALKTGLFAGRYSRIENSLLNVLTL